MTRLLLHPHLTASVVSVAMTSFLVWLSAEFRPDGMLTVAQQSLQFLLIIPSAIGAALGADPHNPGDIRFIAALFIELYLLTLTVIFVRRKL
jgi:hypothetical protein